MLAAEAAAALEDLPAVKPGSGRFYLWLMEAIAWDNLGWSRAQEAARACLLDILAALREGYLPEDLVTLAGIGATGHHVKNVKRDAELRLQGELQIIALTSFSAGSNRWPQEARAHAGRRQRSGTWSVDRAERADWVVSVL